MNDEFSLRDRLQTMIFAGLVFAFCLDRLAPQIYVTFSYFASVGILVGLSQSVAIINSIPKFRSATAWISIVALLHQSWPGRLSRYGRMFAAIGLIAMLFIENLGHWELLASYCAYVLAREVSALPGLYALTPPHQPPR